MSIVVSTIYPDPRRSLARESARCRRSPLPRRSLPVDVVDDRCEPSVFELTRLEPLRKAPAKADSLRSGFGLLPVRNPNMCPGARNGFWRSLVQMTLLLLRRFSIAKRRRVAAFVLMRHVLPVQLRSTQRLPVRRRISRRSSRCALATARTAVLTGSGHYRSSRSL